MGQEGPHLGFALALEIVPSHVCGVAQTTPLGLSVRPFWVRFSRAALGPVFDLDVALAFDPDIDGVRLLVVQGGPGQVQRFGKDAAQSRVLVLGAGQLENPGDVRRAEGRRGEIGHEPAEGSEVDVLGRHDDIAVGLLRDDLERHLVAEERQVEVRVDLEQQWHPVRKYWGTGCIAGGALGLPRATRSGGPPGEGATVASPVGLVRLRLGGFAAAAPNVGGAAESDQ